MKREMIHELAKTASQYNRYTRYIEDYRQQEQAERRNELLNEKFNELMQEIWEEYDEGIVHTGHLLFLQDAWGVEEIEKAIVRYLEKRGVHIEDEEQHGVPGGRYFEPGVEEVHELPEDEWIPWGIELPFE